MSFSTTTVQLGATIIRPTCEEVLFVTFVIIFAHFTAVDKRLVERTCMAALRCNLRSVERANETVAAATSGHY
jgi:hypothetical protein